MAKKSKSSGKKLGGRAKRVIVKAKALASASSKGVVPGHRHRDETGGLGKSAKHTGQRGGGTPGGVPPESVKPMKLPEPVIMLVKLDAIDLGDADAVGGLGGRSGDDKSLQLDELAQSIRMQGVVEPVLLIAKVGQKVHYVCPDGSRRVRAAKIAGLSEIPAAVYPSSFLDRAGEIRATAVVQKVDHTPVDVAIMVADLLESERLKTKADAVSEGHIQSVATRLGKTPRWVADYRYLGRLNKDVLDLVRSGRLPLTHARAISVVGDAETQKSLAHHAARQPDGSGGQNLAQLIRWVGEKRWSLKVIPWNVGESFAGKRACTGCPHNSASDLDLWAIGHSSGEIARERREVADGGPYCSNRSCFEHKREAADRAKEAAAKKVAPLIKSGKLENAGVQAVMEAKLVPAGMKPEAIARVVKTEMDRAEPGGSAKGGKGAESGGDAKEGGKAGGGKEKVSAKVVLSVKEKARQRFEEALQHWQDATRKQLIDELVRRPGGLSMGLHVLCEPTELAGKLTPKISGEDVERKMEIAMQSPGTIELGKATFGLLEVARESDSPLLKALHAAELAVIAEHERRWSSTVDALQDAGRELADASVVFLLRIMGVDVAARPVLATFEKEAGVAEGGEGKGQEARGIKGEAKKPQAGGAS